MMKAWVGIVGAAGFVLVGVACGSSDTGSDGSSSGNGGETNSSSGGSSGGKTSSSGGSSGTSTSSSGGSSSGGLNATTLAQGFGTIIGIVDDQVVYEGIDTNGVTLNVVPIAGGTPTKIVDIAQGERAVARGGAVGIWKSVTSGIGTFSVWTKATGLKAGPASSLVGLFAASADGTRVAFSVAAVGTTSRLAVVDTSSVTASTTYASGANAAIAVSNTCGPFLRFAGTTFLGAYCTGSNTKRARLVMAAQPDTLTSLVSDTTNANGIQPYLQLNKNDTKVLVLGLPDTESGVTQDQQLRIITLADKSVQIIDTSVYDGVLTDDGSEVIYQTVGGALKRASTGMTPNPTEIVAAGAIKDVVGYTTDLSRVLFASTDPDQTTGAVDLQTATTAAANTPAAVASAVQPLGINTTDTHFLYFAGDAMSASLKAKPVGGGAEKELFKDPEVGLLPPSGGGVVVGHDSKEVTIGQSTKLNVFSLSAVDINGNATLLATDVAEDEWAFKDKSLVFAKLIVNGGAPAMGSGIFVLTLP